MSTRRRLERDGVSLSTLDFGGEGPPVLLLHGLAGHAAEWASTAAWLTADHRVCPFDARGHGHSTRRPEDVSPAAQVDDAAFVLDRLAESPAVIVGQSLGGLTALLLAAEHPERVAALVMVEAAPGDGGDGVVAAEATVEALRSWPVPFVDRPAAVEFFRSIFGEGAAGPWAEGMQQRDGGLWPRFNADVMARTIAGMLELDLWDSWRAVTCPAMVVRAARGMIEPDVVARMQAEHVSARVVEIADARHDLHLDRPQAWRRTLDAFLQTVPRLPGDEPPR